MSTATYRDGYAEGTAAAKAADKAACERYGYAPSPLRAEAEVRTDLEAWLSIMRPRTASCHYICRPERLIVPRGNQQLYRFSCVGLVLDAYASIDIEILDGPYPPQTLTDLGRVWPLLRRQSASARAVLGLGGVGPWDVAVPGYLFHAVRLPHRPALDELRFP